MPCNMTAINIDMRGLIEDIEGKVRGSQLNNGSSIAFSSFVFETNTDDTTIAIVVKRHPDLNLQINGVAEAAITSSNGFNSDGRYTTLSENVTWGIGDVSDKTVYLTVPAQTLDGPFEVNLDLVPVSGCNIRKWEEGVAIARVDNGTPYSLAYHISPNDPNARDEIDAGTSIKPALSGYYMFQTILKDHPDPTKPIMVYFHDGNHTDSGVIEWSTTREGYYPEIDGTREHPVKIQSYPGETADLSNSIGFLLEDRKHLHIKNFNMGGFDTFIDYWTDTTEYLLIEDLFVDGLRAVDGSENRAGVRIDFATKSVIRNCNFTDIKLDNGEYNGNLAGILSYRAANILIENNLFDDADSGVYHKVPPSLATQGEQAFTIRNNIFGESLNNKIHLNSNSSIQGHFADTLVYNNLFKGKAPANGYIFNNILLSNKAADGLEKNTGFYFYNNTIVDCDSFKSSGVVSYHFNNAYRQTGTTLIESALYNSESDDSVIGYSDYNISNNITGILRTPTGETTYDTKILWNSAPSSTLLLSANPDTNSFEEVATFENEGINNYTITNINKTNGFAGSHIGADLNIGVIN